MLTHQTLTTFLGWACVLNFALLILASLILMAGKDYFASWHARLFGIPENDVRTIYFKYLAYYKILVLVFFLVPYLVLRLFIH